MIDNVLQYLEESEKRVPDKAALEDEFEKLTYREYAASARKIGTCIAQKTGGQTGTPVAVLIDRNIWSVCAFMGVVYSGNFYVPIDTEMPESRIDLILSTLQPVLMIDARTNRKKSFENAILYSDILTQTEADRQLLDQIRGNRIDTDPLYAIFTSGSTGVPKGVLVSHRSVVDLVNAFSEAFSFESGSVFGNQAPLTLMCRSRISTTRWLSARRFRCCPESCSKCRNCW